MGWETEQEAGSHVQPVGETLNAHGLSLPRSASCDGLCPGLPPGAPCTSSPQQPWAGLGLGWAGWADPKGHVGCGVHQGALGLSSQRGARARERVTAPQRGVSGPSLPWTPQPGPQGSGRQAAGWPWGAVGVHPYSPSLFPLITSSELHVGPQALEEDEELLA